MSHTSSGDGASDRERQHEADQDDGITETRSPFICLSRLSVPRNSTHTAAFDPHKGALRLGVIILVSVIENQGSEIKCLSHVPMVIGIWVSYLNPTPGQWMDRGEGR